MNLKDYLKLYNITKLNFSESLGISNVSLSRYISGERLPEKKILKKIFEISGGLVDANDFYLEKQNSQFLTDRQKENISEIVRQLKNGNKNKLAKAITIIESSLHSHKLESNFLLSKLKDNQNTIRIGVTGVPGVGKSTFIESFGMKLIDMGHKVSVLAVDPSSKRSGGSILGDKTRMTKLSVNKNAFIRPSPSQGHLGGVAKKTSESIRCFEEAGFDIIFVETMGVGQAETAVYEMVDIFLVLLLPSGGDELQGIKKGIIEIADLIVVNKADGNLKKSAEITMSEYKNAQKMITKVRKDQSPEVLMCSSIESLGIKEVWNFIEKFIYISRKNGSFFENRQKQKIKSIWSNISSGLDSYIETNLKTKEFVKKIIKDVENNKLDVNNASKIIFDYIVKG